MLLIIDCAAALNTALQEFWADCAMATMSGGNTAVLVAPVAKITTIIDSSN